MTESELLPVRLPQTCVLDVGGSDAAEFLQAQLSQGVKNLSDTDSVVAGWHDARGRVRAVFRALRSESGYTLLGPADLADELVRTMRMFVLRADVQIAQSSQVCGGLIADASADTLEDTRWSWLPRRRNAVARSADLTAICVAAGCWQLVGPADALPLRDARDSAAIVAASLRAGLPQLTSATTLRYVPHMLNLDRLGAIDFDKGCYPGQEIIARTEHLGSVKRRVRAFALGDPDDEHASDTSTPDVPSIDTPIVDVQGNRLGEVLCAARERSGNIVVLGVVKIGETDSTHLADRDGPLLKPLRLPFE